MNNILKLTTAGLMASAFAVAPLFAGDTASKNSDMLKSETSVESNTDASNVSPLPADDTDTSADAGADVDMDTTASISLSDEQKSQLSTAFADVDAEPVDADFQATIGAKATEAITLQPLPSEAATVFTDGKDYQYFVGSDGKIVIVAPDTREVVHVVDEAA